MTKEELIKENLELKQQLASLEARLKTLDDRLTVSEGAIVRIHDRLNETGSQPQPRLGARCAKVAIP